ncbi:alpha/beta hydrolase family protein [Kitasatospora sp. McL0602]|uniref:alpha/beta hydrolase family protein n=1 Tax=Kitasatospora sp. McL0602 TaxID=3439530 RepID=UPI003F88CECE
MQQQTVATPAGDARTTRYPAVGPAKALLVLGHGAGGGVEARDLQALAGALPPRGIAVALVEQPWRVAGRKVAPAPKTLDAGWLPVLAALTAECAADGVPVVVGGRSAGARVACRTALETGAAAVLALSFPLHPPGRPDRSRAAELTESGRPTLVLQGAQDTFGTPEEFPELPSGHRLVAVPYGNHSFAVPKRAPYGQEEALELITGAAGDWLLELFG